MIDISSTGEGEQHWLVNFDLIWLLWLDFGSISVFVHFDWFYSPHGFGHGQISAGNSGRIAPVELDPDCQLISGCPQCPLHLNRISFALFYCYHLFVWFWFYLAPRFYLDPTLILLSFPLYPSLAASFLSWLFASFSFLFAFSSGFHGIFSDILVVF